MKKQVFNPNEGFGSTSGKDFLDKMAERVATIGEHVLEIPLDKARVKENVRKDYTEIENLAESIQADGLISPITVQKAEDGFFDILTGHRRFKAFLYLNENHPGKYTKIRALVFDKQLTPEEVTRIQLIENIQREGLTPLEMKNALEALRESGMTNLEIAQKLGKSEGHVKNLISVSKIVDQTPEIEALMKSNTGITLGDLLYLRVLPKAELLQVAGEKAKGIIKTRAELEARIAEVKGASDSEYRQNRLEKKVTPLFLLSENSFKVRSFTFDLEKFGEAEKKLLTTLQEILTKLEALK